VRCPRQDLLLQSGRAEVCIDEILDVFPHPQAQLTYLSGTVRRFIAETLRVPPKCASSL
jgi:hypothetical protein